MKISEIIQKLQFIKEKEGDLRITNHVNDCDFHDRNIVVKEYTIISKDRSFIEKVVRL